jgi:hypothetical protein
VLGERRELALKFRELATLRVDESLLKDVEDLRWRGPTAEFARWVARTGDARIVQRAEKAGRKARG